MKAGIDPGRIALRLTCRGDRVAEVAVASERPAASEVLRGLAADDVPRMVPLLFALCGKAQGRAAELAVAAARGATATPAVDADVAREALREHLWRWLLDLPPLLGLPPLREDFPRVARAIAAGHYGDLLHFLADARLGELRARLGRIADIEREEPAFLPRLDAAASLATWPRFSADFCQRPQWKGAAAETGARARQGAGVAGTTGAIAARWLARLAELEQGAHGVASVGMPGTASAVPLAPAVGRALVETARGLLMHEVRLDADGRVADYRIVAPTEWNFHPEGPLHGWLVGCNAGDEEQLRSLVGRAVLALDPCVRWELEIAG